MALRKVLDADLDGRGIIPLPNRPTLPAQTMKQRFDQLARDVIIPILNQNVDTQNVTNAQVPQAVTDSKNALERSSSAYQMAQKALNVVQEGGYEVTSPPTGNRVSLQQALNDLYDILRIDALEAGEYDALLIEASVYDAKNITANDYDLRSRILLGG